MAMMPSDPAPPSPAPSAPAPSSNVRDKLSPERVAELREWVEGSTLSLKRIGQALGVSASTLSRYAAQGGWRRPPGAAAAARIERPIPEPERRRRAPRPVTGERRQEITEKLWRLAERHAEELESQPIERAHRALQPLARLTRTLGEMDKPVRPPFPPEDAASDLDQPEGRSLHELRDELQAHLDRIMQEEGYGWEVREWWFEDGAGI